MIIIHSDFMTAANNTRIILVIEFKVVPRIFQKLLPGNGSRLNIVFANKYCLSFQKLISETKDNIRQ